MHQLRSHTPNTATNADAAVVTTSSSASMCLIHVKPEPGSDTERGRHLPPRIVTERRSSRARHGSVSRGGSIRRSRNSVRESRNSVIETIQIPPPPSSIGGGAIIRETQIIQTRPPPLSHHTVVKYDARNRSRSRHREDTSEYRGSHASVISTASRDRRGREREYYIDQGRSPRNSYRRLTAEDALRSSGGGAEILGYNNFHGRRSGSVNYVNPRHSHRSVRSTGGGRMSRERVVVVDTEGGYSR